MKTVHMTVEPEKVKAGEPTTITVTVDNDADATRGVKDVEVTFEVVGSASEPVPNKGRTNAKGQVQTKVTPQPGDSILMVDASFEIQENPEDPAKKSVRQRALVQVQSILDDKLAELLGKQTALLAAHTSSDQVQAKLDNLLNAIAAFVKVTPVPNGGAILDGYRKAHARFVTTLTSIQKQIETLEKAVNDKAPADQRAAIQGILGNADKEIKAKEEQKKRLQRELAQLQGSDLPAAENEQHELAKLFAKRRVTEFELDKVLKGMSADTKQVADTFTGEDVQARDLLEAHRRLLYVRSVIAEQISPYLLDPAAFQKQLEDSWKAWEAAKQKVNQVNLNIASKQAELDGLSAALDAARADRGLSAAAALIDSVAPKAPEPAPAQPSPAQPVAEPS